MSPAHRRMGSKEKNREENYTYILRCRDGSLYTGWTNDLSRRVRTHNAGKGAKYTKSRRPVQLVYFEVFQEKQEAQSREVLIKQLSHKKKEVLIQGLSEERRRTVDKINAELESPEGRFCS